MARTADPVTSPTTPRDSAAMIPDAAARNRRAITLGVLGLSAVLALVSQVQLVAGGGDSFRTADWQINYAGGFVRRGLFGELLFLLTPGGQVTLWVLLAVQVACYVPVYAVVIGHLARERWSWSAMALACGPLALPFIGWDVNGGFRKEILAFAALALLVGLRRDATRRALWPLAGLSLVLWILAVFSWEPAALMLPAGLYLLLARTPELPGRLPGARALAAGFALVAVVGLALSVATAGDHGQAAQVCASLRAAGIPTVDACGGAIAALADGAAHGMYSVSRAWPGYAGYPALLAAAALPILLSPWLRRHWRWALAAALATLPLYVIAVDYGRWGHLLFLELLFCLVIGPAGDDASRLWNPLATLLFVGVFGIPNAGPMNENRQWPLGGLLGTVIQIAQLGLYRLTG